MRGRDFDLGYHFMDDPRQSLPGSTHTEGSLGIRDPRLSGPLSSYGTGALFGEKFPIIGLDTVAGSRFHTNQETHYSICSSVPRSSGHPGSTRTEVLMRMHGLLHPHRGFPRGGNPRLSNPLPPYGVGRSLGE